MTVLICSGSAAPSPLPPPALSVHHQSAAMRKSASSRDPPIAEPTNTEPTAAIMDGPLADRARRELTPARVLRTLFSMGTLRRLLSAEMWDICSTLLFLLWFRMPAVLLARLIDVSRGLGKLTWSRARYAPGEFASELFSVLLDALGATFVKLSQVIAHSPMVAPEALVRACKASLAQCTAPVVEWDAVASLLRREFRVQSLLEVFESVEASPMASASIAQVHGAVLLDGRRVVIKLVRPGVRERLAVDLDLLWLVARLGDVLLGPLISELLASSAAEMVDELRQAILAECDLRVELSNLGRFRAWLSSSLALRRAGLSGAVWAPEPILPVCTASVLTMERVDGKPLSDLRGHLASATDVTAADVTTVGKVVAGAAADGETADAPQEAGEAPSTTAWKVALAKALAVQALSIIDGSSSGRAAPAIFHADLHMGNMLFDEQSGTMAFVDFGVCGALPPHLRGALLLQALSFVLGDTAYFSEGFAYAMRTMPKAPTSAMAHRQSTATIPEATGAAEGARAPTPITLPTTAAAVATTAAQQVPKQARRSVRTPELTPPPAPSTAAPAEPSPAESSPADGPSPAEPSPAESSPAEPSPAEPSPAELPLAESSPVAPAPLDTAALTADLAPLFDELAPINPLRPDNTTGKIDPALYALLVRGQMLLHAHGVQLPKEFTLLIKTMCFGADYLSLFQLDERHLISAELSRAASAYVTSNAREVASVVPPRALARVGSAAARAKWRAAREAIGSPSEWRARERARELALWVRSLSSRGVASLGRKPEGGNGNAPPPVSGSLSGSLTIVRISLLALLLALLVGSTLPFLATGTVARAAYVGGGSTSFAALSESPNGSIEQASVLTNAAAIPHPSGQARQKPHYVKRQLRDGVGAQL